MNSGPLAPMLSGPVIASVFGILCLVVLVFSLLTGSTIMFPSTQVIRIRQSPVYFSIAICFWLFCVVAAGFVVFH